MIRPMEKKDLDQVMDIWLEANLEAHDFIPERYWRGNLALAREALPQAEVYADVGDHGAIRGFVGLSDTYIEGIFVKRECRSRGIGRNLLDHVKARKKALSLKVYQRNQRAVQFYLREGFWIQAEGSEEESGEREYQMVWSAADSK